MGLGSGIRDPGSEIRDPEKTYSGSRIQGSKRHRIPDPDPQHWEAGTVFMHDEQLLRVVGKAYLRGAASGKITESQYKRMVTMTVS